jgi:cyanate permease
METRSMTFLVAALITLIPLIVLVVAAVLTDRLNSRAGGQPADLTYRAYGA